MRIGTILLALLMVTMPVTALVPETDIEPVSPSPVEILGSPDPTLRGDGLVYFLATFDAEAPSPQRVAALGLSEVHRFTAVPTLALAGAPADVAASIAEMPGLQMVEYDAPLQYHLSTATTATRAADIWGYNTWPGPFPSGLHTPEGELIDGTGVVAAVIDSGIDGAHPDLWSDQLAVDGLTPPTKVLACRNYGDLVPDHPYCDETVGHGTHVAGIVAGNSWAERNGFAPIADGHYYGVAPGAQLVGAGLGAGIFVINAAIAQEWVLNNIETYDIKVVNNSYGDEPGCSASFPSGTSINLFRQMIGKGTTVVFSAGNYDTTSVPTQPTWTGTTGRMPDAGMIMVSNYNDQGTGTRNGVISNLSSDGCVKSGGQQDLLWTWPDIAAPGTSIVSTAIPAGVISATWDPPFYASASGTSMSAPHIAGIVALMYQAYPDITPEEVEQILIETATPWQDNVASRGRTGSASMWGSANTAALDFVDPSACYVTPTDAARAAAGDASVNTKFPRFTELPNPENYICRDYRRGVGLADAYAAVEAALALALGGVDTDGDGHDDGKDNCPSTPNADQADVDGDGIGDACDDDPDDGPLGDSDGDGVANKDDLCQGHDDGLDNDGDGIPNGCDPTPDGGTSGSSTTYYFDRGDLLTGNAGNANGVLYGMLQLKEETPTWSDPAVMHVSYLDGTGGGHNTLYDAGVWGGAPAFDGGDVTVTWWMANPATGPGFFETFELKVLCGGTAIKTLAHTGPSGTGGLPSRYEATLTGVPACAGDVGVLIDPQGLLGDPGQPFTNVDYFLFYDAVDYPSSATFTTVISNVAPTADAGEDQTVDEEDSVGLNGTGSSDSDGNIVAYAWQQTAGPTATLTDADSATPSFTAPAVDGDTDLVFRLTVTDDGGATGTDTVTVSVRDTFYLAPDVQITNPTDGETIDADGGLAVAGDFDPAARFPAEGTQSLPLDLAVGWEDPDQGGNGDYVFVDAPGAGTVVEGDTTLVGRAGNSPTDPNGCQTDCCETGCEFDFGEPQADDIRPGDLSQVCTLNFIYEHEGRYFFGSAAHCAATGSNTDTNGCTTAPQAIGSSQTLRARGGHTITTKLAYSSWGTMQANGESNDNACFGNDFALFEIDPADLDKVHPSVRMYGGPTGLGAISDMIFMDDIRGYGRSSLHDDYIVRDPDESLTNPKNGYYLGSSNGGWSYWVYLLPQGIPGDSGGGIMDIHGNALGAASTISAAGASNNYANIARALDYMQAKEGWAPTLVTWDEFDPDPRISMVTGDSSSSQALPEGVLGEDAGHSHMLVEGRPVPELTVVGGAVGEVGAPVFSNTDTHLIVSLPLEGDFDGAIPSSSGTPISYEVGFRTDHNGVQLDHRVTYEWSSYAWRDALAGNLEEEPFTDAFGVFVETAADAVGSFICPIATDLSGSSFDIDTSTVHWVIPLTAFDQDNKPAGNNCGSFVRTGEPLTAGDTLTNIVSGAVLTTVNVNWGSAFGLFTGPTADDYTLAGCDCGPVVTFTVNGQDAGSADVTADAWNHPIDFSGFTPDELGRFVVVATFGTATETVVYHAPGGDPCARVQSKIVITLGDHTACTDYDPSVAGPWETSFDDISDLTPGAYALTATAYDDAGAVLDSHTITVHVADPDSDGDGVPDGEDNCIDVHNPGQADLDGDGQGDACDEQDNRDSDSDGVENWQDVCPGHDDNADLDGDGTPDGCDDDRDGDGFSNDEEGRAGTDPDDAGSKPPGPTCDQFAGHPGGPPHCRDD